MYRKDCTDVSFFFNDTATTEIYTLSLHDALPICRSSRAPSGATPTLPTSGCVPRRRCARWRCPGAGPRGWSRSEEHTSELQSRQYLVCRLLLEKKKNNPLSRQPWRLCLGPLLRCI